MPKKSAVEIIPPGFQLKQTLHGHEGVVHCLEWLPDGSTLASSSSDRTIRLWNAETGRLLRTFGGHAYAVDSLAASPDGTMLATGAGTNKIRVWEIGSGKQNQTLEVRWSFLSHGLAWSPDGRVLASADREGIICLWDVETGVLDRKLQAHTNAVTDIKWSPDGRTLASASTDETICLWNYSSGELIQKLIGHSGSIRCIEWSPNGKALTSGGSDNAIRIWDAHTGQTTTILERHTNIILSLSFSFDGRLLASKSYDGHVRFWRCDNWESVAVVDEESSRAWPTGLAFHPSLPVLATLGERDKIIRIWELDLSSILGASLVSESVNYTTAKIALVGDSGVGKTGLGWRLAHREFKDHPSTHGQQFWVIDELSTRRGDGAECEAVLWDLAGQPDYRLVHALFLDDVDLALVLFDPTNRQEPLKGVEYWLKQLSCKGRNRRTILVGARADRGTPTLTQQELEEFCEKGGVDGGYVGTSALTGDGLKDLMARVKASIVWDQMPATVTTTTFKRIKEFVLKLKEDQKRRGVLVRPAELRLQLEATDPAWKFSDAEMMTAIRHLTNHGYVSVLRGSSGEETILLFPELLANVASSFVLEARRNPKGLGALEEARVLGGEYSFPEFAGLDDGERDVLLDAATVLFLEHNLCFRETIGEQTLLIFPALINQKRPQLDDAEKVDDYSYRVSGAVEHVYAALVVQLGYTNTFTRTNQWQNQAEYETARGDVCGFRQIAEREGEIELVLYYAENKPNVRLLFQGLFEEFLRGRDVTVLKYPPVSCTKCHYQQPRVEAVKRIEEGIGFLFCSQCGKKIILPKLGMGAVLIGSKREKLNREQARTRQRTAFEAALVRVKAIVRDERKTIPSCFISYAWGDLDRERWVRKLATYLQNAGIDTILDQKDNVQLGSNVARFISRIEQSDFIIVVGTRLYRRKYENKLSATGSVVAAEVDLINLRLMGNEEQKKTVLPLLLEGDEEASLPPLVRGKVYGNFIEEALYFSTLFDLILTLYRIPFVHPAVSDLRDVLREGSKLL
jgi:small GTP-binding protein